MPPFIPPHGLPMPWRGLFSFAIPTADQVRVDSAIVFRRRRADPYRIGEKANPRPVARGCGEVKHPTGRPPAPSPRSLVAALREPMAAVFAGNQSIFKNAQHLRGLAKTSFLTFQCGLGSLRRVSPRTHCRKRKNARKCLLIHGLNPGWMREAICPTPPRRTII